MRAERVDTLTQYRAGGKENRPNRNVAAPNREQLTSATEARQALTTTQIY